MATIKIYTTPICSFCTAAKRLLASKPYSYEEVDVSLDPALRQQLSEENGGFRTVPMIFIGGRFIGGYEELKALDSKGKLDMMIETTQNH